MRHVYEEFDSPHLHRANRQKCKKPRKSDVYAVSSFLIQNEIHFFVNFTKKLLYLYC